MVNFGMCPIFLLQTLEWGKSKNNVHNFKLCFNANDCIIDVSVIISQKHYLNIGKL